MNEDATNIKARFAFFSIMHGVAVKEGLFSPNHEDSLGNHNYTLP